MSTVPHDAINNAVLMSVGLFLLYAVRRQNIIQLNIEIIGHLLITIDLCFVDCKTTAETMKNQLFILTFGSCILYDLFIT